MGMAFFLLGRFMQWTAAGVGDGGFGHWRPFRTRGFQGIPTRHCVPGFDEPSRRGEDCEMGIKIRAPGTGYFLK
jgi:hypothetical protein